MTRENIVLSLNPDGQKLHRQESVFRALEFGIISAATPLQAFAICLTLRIFSDALAQRVGHLPDGDSDDNIPQADGLPLAEHPPLPSTYGVPVVSVQRRPV